MESLLGFNLFDDGTRHGGFWDGGVGELRERERIE